MADIGAKRKAIRMVEESTKRVRIETASYENGSSEDEEEEEGEHPYLYDGEDNSEDDQSQTADTPITPFSPSRKFPSELKTIRCTYEGCTKTFNRPARLASHLRSHTNERPFVCSYAGCDKTYMEEKHLKQHVKGSHTHEKAYQCDRDGCSKSFLTATRLRRHREAHEGHERFRCTAFPPCNQTFRKHQTLQRHIRADHLQLAAFPCTYIDSNTQVACDAGFDAAGSLRKHEDRVHGALRFWCDECSFSRAINSDGTLQQVGFRTKPELAKHIRTEHSNCIFCDLKCSNQAELQKHIETQHSSSAIGGRKSNLAERKIIPCNHPGCGKTFTKKYNLTAHVRSAHNGERFLCSASSAMSNILKAPDLAFWTGDNACEKDFVSRVNLEDHVRTQHLGLPSIVNSKRMKGRGPLKKKGGSPLNNDDDGLDAINLLTGAGYGQDQNRNISCLIADCPWLFKRNYDLEVHLKSKHGFSASDIESAAEAALASLGPGTETLDFSDSGDLDEMYQQADLEWDMQRTATKDGVPFWIGADDEVHDGAGDAWSQEEKEMRRLIDQELGYDRFVDPALVDN